MSRSARTAAAAVCAVALTYLLLTVLHVASAPLGNGDLFWQVRAGEMILQAGRVVEADPFSYVIEGAPWNNHQWGHEILVALLHRAGGWGGFRLAVTLLFVGLLGGLALFWARARGWPAAVLLVCLLFQLAFYKFLPASQTLSMAIFLPAYLLLGRAETFASPRRTAALLVLLLLWGNLTAEALTFLPFLVIDMGLALLQRWRGGGADDPGLRGATRRGALLLGLALCVPMINPPGSSVLNYLLQGTAINAAVNSEFTPIWLPAATAHPLTKGLARALMAAYLLYAFAALLRSPARLATMRRVAPGLLCLAAATLHERSLWLLIIPAWLLVQAALDLAAARRRPALAAMVALALAALVHLPFVAAIGLSPARSVQTLTWSGHYQNHLNSARIPAACAAQLRRDAHRGKAVFAPRLWASYVIWAAPGVKVFYDGRNREYPEQVHWAGQQVEAAAPKAASVLESTKTDLVLERPGWGRGNTELRRKWRRLGGAKNCAIFTRRAGAR